MSEIRPRILLVEPYYGGSHREFLKGLQGAVTADYTLVTLPARKWKTRMQLAAPWAAEQISKLKPEARRFTAVLSSSFIDLALFRTLVGRLPGWSCTTRFCLYFHENQFSYPGQVANQDNRQFAAMNYGSALAADRVAFNSAFNRDSFFSGSNKYLKIAADMKVNGCHQALAERVSILPPGLTFPPPTPRPRVVPGATVPTIVWNHRWEHDKNPERFFAALRDMKKNGVAFRLLILGQAFSTMPVCFAEAKEEFAHELLHFGYVRSKKRYWELLRQGDIVVSTARHEFFGLAVLEAVRAGCRPLLPARLSYPELFPDQYLYQEEQLEPTLAGLLRNPRAMSTEECWRLTEPYSWQTLKDRYRDWLLATNSPGQEASDKRP